MQPTAVNRESRLLCSDDLWDGVWIIIRLETFRLVSMETWVSGRKLGI